MPQQVRPRLIDVALPIEKTAQGRPHLQLIESPLLPSRVVLTRRYAQPERVQASPVQPYAAIPSLNKAFIKTPLLSNAEK